MPPKSSNRLYWFLQSAGWALLAIISIVFLRLDEPVEESVGLISPIILICLGGLFLTHLLRLIIRRFRLFGLPILHMLLAIFACNALMAGAVVGVFTVWDLALGVELGNQSLIELFTLGLNSTLLFLIWSLIYFAVYTFRNYRHEEIERLKAEHAMRDSELARLKSQMNPHFVFNALNSIRALVMEDPDKAQQSITQLSHLLRGFLLSDRHKTVTLKEEVRTVLDYLELEKLRYENRLRYNLTVAIEAEDVQVPTMMVQTLVENAIKHGISKTVQGGELCIRAQVESKLLIIEIENSGQLNGSAFRPDGGFGLANTRLRLQLLFGNAATFDIAQAEPGRVVARVTLPIALPNAATVHLADIPLSA